MLESLDVFRSDRTVVDTIVDKLVLGVGAEKRNLDLIFELVVEFIIFSHVRAEGICWNARKIGMNLDQGNYLIYPTMSIASVWVAQK